MEPMEDENCERDFEEIYQEEKSAEDLRFDLVLNELQQIMIDPQFQNTLGQFMENNWACFGENGSAANEQVVFQQYRGLMRSYIEQNLKKKIADFEWGGFWQLFESRKQMVDEQILDTLLSLEEVESFKSFIRDYRKSYEEVEMFKVLSVKSNKISENKKVKGKDNIFAGNDNPLFDKALKPLPKKKEMQEKTEEELLVPDLILTVKSMKKI